uniref:peptidylprolyl isomerase n=2 Tax=Chloropicon roscoffensis TaxID=1461544 RepID=A0A7S3C7N9_9CHLO
METTNTRGFGVVMVGGASGSSIRTTSYTRRRRMRIMMKNQGLANQDLSKRRTRDIKPPPPPPTTTTRRHLALGTFIWGSVFASSSSSSSLALDSECASCSDSNSSLQPGDKAFRVSNTGLRVLDVKEGKGDQASKGQVVVLDWSGYTAGYQAKRIDNTSGTDNQFVFTLGADPPQAIPAFEEAVLGMRQGGVRRVEIPGELEEALAYPVQKNARYDRGPVPFSLGGRRALDFVLDNKTLKPFNKTLLFDIRLNNIRK